MNISLLANFWSFFWKKTDFRPVFRFSAKRKNGRFSVILAGTGSVCQQTATYQKTESFQSYLRIWGTYDPIELGPSDPKKWGLYRRSVKKCRFSGQNRALAAAPRPAVQRGQHKNNVFLLSGHDGNKKVGRFWQKNGFWAKKLHFRPKILHFFTLHLWNPHFFGSDGPDSMGS